MALKYVDPFRANAETAHQISPELLSMALFRTSLGSLGAPGGDAVLPERRQLGEPALDRRAV